MSAVHQNADVVPGLSDDPDGPLLAGPSGIPILAMDPSPPLVADRGRIPEWAMRLLVLALGCGIFLPNLGSFGLWDPWETHYGEVTRYMIESGDWVHPWWGYRGDKLAGEAGPGEHFYSKPILIFWMEAATIRAIGLSELAIRLPVALIAILAMFAVYLALSKILGRWPGFLAALVLATCPEFVMIGRQAQTDMPFVGTLTIAMSALLLALFGPTERRTDRGTWARLSATALLLLVLVLPQLGIIASDVNHALPNVPGQVPSAWDRWRLRGANQAITYLLLLVPLIWSMFAIAVADRRKHGGRFSEAFKDSLARKCALWVAYMFFGLATMGKGLLGFALPGFILVLYLLLTNDWALLLQKTERGWRGRMEILRGLGIFVCVTLPWYVALLSGPEGNAFYTRFFIHDHFNRLGSGVHSIDDGTFEHFLKWLGFGMWPWVLFVPLAIARVTRHRLRNTGPKARMELFLFLWVLGAYTLFTLSSTKFHHYIFPALPPLAMLVGWSLWDLRADRTWMPRVAVVVALALLGTIAWDLTNDPQHFRNQFTYKYDRAYPSDDELPTDRDGLVRFDKERSDGWEPTRTWEESDFYAHTPETLHSILNVHLFRYPTWIRLTTGLVILSLILMLFVRWRRWGLWVLGSTSVAFAAWLLSFYMPSLAPHWSQKYLFDKYYDTCLKGAPPPEIADAFAPAIAGIPSLEEYFEPRGKPMCAEESISWRLTWRGETFYSNNTIRPIGKEKTQMPAFLTDINKGARFYVHTERRTARDFKRQLKDTYVKPLQQKGNPDFVGIADYDVTLEHNENLWFVLLKAQPICKAGYEQDTLGRCRRPHGS